MLGFLLRDPLSFVLFLAAAALAVTFHEFAHALVASAQGDPTARRQGRLSLNPARHLDPLGSLAFVLVGFGWGKPVPFNPYALRNRRAGEVMVGLAGPLSNLVLAFLSGGLLVALTPLFGSFRPGPGTLFLEFFFKINVILAVFNLLPLPPLDGSRLLTGLFPPERNRLVAFLSEYGFYILLGLVFLGGLRFVGPLTNGLGRLILRLAALAWGRGPVAG
jgi:Zn-dependent protease